MTVMWCVSGQLRWHVTV